MALPEISTDPIPVMMKGNFYSIDPSKSGPWKSGPSPESSPFMFAHTHPDVTKKVFVDGTKSSYGPITMMLLICVALVGSCHQSTVNSSVRLEQYPNEIIENGLIGNFDIAKMALYVINFNSNVEMYDLNDSMYNRSFQYVECSLRMFSYEIGDSSKVFQNNINKNSVRFAFFPKGPNGNLVRDYPRSEIAFSVIVDKESNKILARDINDGVWIRVTKNDLNLNSLKQYIDNGGKVDPWLRAHRNLLDSISSGWPPK